MGLLKKILALVFTAFAFLLLFALQFRSSSDGFDIRLVALDKAGFLEAIDDERARTVFAGLSVGDITEKGERDRLTASRWCGLKPGEADSLFEMGFVQDRDPEYFIAARPVEKPYRRFGTRDLGDAHLAVRLDMEGDCLDVYLTEFH